MDSKYNGYRDYLESHIEEKANSLLVLGGYPDWGEDAEQDSSMILTWYDRGTPHRAAPDDLTLDDVHLSLLLLSNVATYFSYRLCHYLRPVLLLQHMRYIRDNDCHRRKRYCYYRALKSRTPHLCLRQVHFLPLQVACFQRRFIGSAVHRRLQRRGYDTKSRTVPRLGREGFRWLEKRLFWHC
jgi:hypothetical protein